MKGLLLAGGTGSRLFPITKSVSKQMLPIYDKPMIYYPLSTLMLAGIQEIAIITSPNQIVSFSELLGDGSQFGIKLTYLTQDRAEGIAQALVIGETFLKKDSCMLILGDNIFHGVGLGHSLTSFGQQNGAHIFTQEVADPSQYGILSINKDGLPSSIVEKPFNSDSKLAITGLYYFDNQAPSIAKSVSRSQRGEYEITSVLTHYLELSQLTYTPLSRGTVWLDTGTVNSLHSASDYVQVVQNRSGLMIGCLEEIAYLNSWISRDKLAQIALNYKNTYYGNYLASLL
jgi:glucose-1-phosphate thymidylyltransferase